MAGTDRSRGDPGALAEGAPAIILVKPQLGENIGACARAMLNCALTEMRLVAPRDGWPNPDAVPPASGADLVLDRAKLFDRTEAAIADLTFVLATTARPRDMAKPVLTPVGAAAELRARTARGERTGILFGGERSGLDNEDVALADAVLTVPLNPAFSSLNLAQAVLLVGHGWFAQGDATAPWQLPIPEAERASQADLDNLMARLALYLDQDGFFASPEMRPVILRNIRTALLRAGLSRQEVQTFHGVFKSVTGARAAEKD